MTRHKVAMVLMRSANICPELDSNSVEADSKRPGVGSFLLKTWLALVDADNGATYCWDSWEGKALCLSFGYEEKGTSELDISAHGMDEPFVGYAMVRPAQE